MDISEYRARYFVDPPPVPLYAFEGIGGSLYILLIMMRQLAVGTPAEADWLYAAFVAAGGRGEGSCDTWTYDPIRLCSVQDPFGTKLIITAPQVGRSEGRSRGSDSV